MNGCKYVLCVLVVAECPLELGKRLHKEEERIITLLPSQTPVNTKIIKCETLRSWQRAIF